MRVLFVSLFKTAAREAGFKELLVASFKDLVPAESPDIVDVRTEDEITTYTQGRWFDALDMIVVAGDANTTLWDKKVSEGWKSCLCERKESFMKKGTISILG
jgi:hypothetical protein